MSTGDPRLVGRALNSQRLFSWGANSYGQLSSGHCDDTSVPQEVSSTSHQEKSCITVITGGGGHTLGLLDNGKLLVCGSNDKGQLGLGSTENTSVLTPVKDLEGEIITKAVGGWDFTLILNERGQIFVTGSHYFNQLGLPDLEEKYIIYPRKLILPDNPIIVDIAAGLRHGMALSDKGCIYQWGRRKSSKPKDKHLQGPLPRIVDLPPDLKGRIIKITAGSYFFAALTDCGEILCWGENNYGQLTIAPEQAKEVSQPYIIPGKYFNGKVIDIQTGWTHVLAITDQRTVFSWGRANYGQLGRKVDLHFDPIPQPVSGLENVTCVRCGSEHNLALTENGELITWGWNEHGLCGHGNEDNLLAPQKVAALSGHVIKLIGCGSGHSFALTDMT